MRFIDKTVLIIGGNSGIGLAAAQRFAAEGALVIITGRDQTTIDAAVGSIPKSKGYRADVSDLSAIDDLVASLQADGTHIDVLFVNAGVGAFAPIRDVTPELWDHLHSINLRGCFFAVQKALPLMGNGGSIVLTGSIGAEAAVPGNAVYAATKAGLRAALRILAKELVGEGIRVNMVSPGPTETPLIRRNVGMNEAEVDGLRKIMTSVVPMNRMGEATEVAAAVLFLASTDASFITGADLFVDGGTMELR